MPQFIIAIILIILGIWVLGFVLASAVVSCFVWGGAIGIGLIGRHVTRENLKHTLAREAPHNGTVDLSFDGKRLSTNVVASSLKTHLAQNSYEAIWIILTIVSGGVIYCGLLLVQPEFFKADPWDQQIYSGHILAGIVSALIIIVWLVQASSKEQLHAMVSEHLSRMVGRANEALVEADTLAKVLGSMEELVAELEINFEPEYHEQVTRFVFSHLSAIVKDPSELKTLISSQLQKAQRDCQNLQKASHHFKEVDALYRTAAKNVTRAGSMALLTELDHLGDAMHSVNLKSLLESGKWSEYHEVLDSMALDLEKIDSVALRYKSERDHSVPDFNSPAETELDRAYRILRVPPTVTDDQLKRAYKHLAQLWHPDKGHAPDHSEFVEIHRAYRLVQKSRGFN